jgi:hypothetical protein
VTQTSAATTLSGGLTFTKENGYKPLSEAGRA